MLKWISLHFRAYLISFELSPFLPHAIHILGGSDDESLRKIDEMRGVERAGLEAY